MNTDVRDDLAAALPASHVARAERLSALVDGELDDADAHVVAQQVARDDALAARWLAYHQIGDVLRSAELCPRDDQRFVEALRVRLSREAVVVVPAAARRPHHEGSATAWKWASGLATVTAVAAIAWGVLPGSPVKNGSKNETLAQVPVVAPATAVADGSTLQVVNTANGAMLRDARLDQYFSAHSHVGGMISMPASFVRNAAIESAPAR
ncbi:MAG: sigma-E factor negative regulatory protein [Betaproteobacteria bacterium]|nr:sigma-E factor negative regulatory protein [Betaproteobacteria bacterium]